MAYTNSSLSTYRKISPNKTSPRNHTIDRLTVHCFVGQVTAKRGCEVFQNKSRNASCNYVIGKDGDIGLCVEEKDRSWCSSNRDNDMRAITFEVASDSKHPYAVTDAALNALIDLITDICKRNGKKKVLWFADKNKTLSYNPKPDEIVMTVHRWFANKACPGDYLYNKHSYIAEEVNKRLGVISSSMVTSTPNDTIQNTYSHNDFVKDVQKAILAKVDGIAGSETLSKTITVSRTKNNRHAVVRPIQKYLNSIGYNCGVVDGIAGIKFDSAVKAFQRANGCVIDGEITAQKTTWKKLLRLP